jgi:chromatin segregation and condensation protein Rec8/ScpA/Scc1 (kleisin family)
VLPFEELFPLERGIPGVVSTFLAILELTRLLQLRIEQGSIKDPLLVRLREDN